MILHSALVFTLAIFNAPIFAIPSMLSSEGPSDPSSLLSRRPLSARSDQFLSSLQTKRALGRGIKPGAKCDGTFYKQSRVDLVAQRVCQSEKKKTTKPNPRSKLARISHPFLPRLFPNVDPLSLGMARITSSLFSANRFKSFFARTAKNDFVVLTGECQVLGLVRRLSATELELCKYTQAPTRGGPANFGPGTSNPGLPQPVRPAGADIPVPASAAGGSNPGFPGFPQPVRPAA